MAKVEIYLTPWCPYCRMAVRLLEKKGVEFEEYRVDLNPSLREEMMERASGSHTVPQIFIDGKHIGGCDDMTELDMDDELDPLLGLQES